MRMEYVVVSLVIVLVVLVVLIMFSGNIVPMFKDGISNLAKLIGLKVEQP